MEYKTLDIVLIVSNFVYIIFICFLYLFTDESSLGYFLTVITHAYIIFPIILVNKDRRFRSLLIIYVVNIFFSVVYHSIEVNYIKGDLEAYRLVDEFMSSLSIFSSFAFVIYGKLETTTFFLCTLPGIITMAFGQINSTIPLLNLTNLLILIISARVLYYFFYEALTSYFWVSFFFIVAISCYFVDVYHYYFHSIWHVCNMTAMYFLIRTKKIEFEAQESERTERDLGFTKG